MIRMIDQTQSLMCSRKGDMIYVESPNKDTSRLYSNMGVEIPSHLSISKFKEKVLDIS